jgi:hypothetical protein
LEKYQKVKNPICTRGKDKKEKNIEETKYFDDYKESEPWWTQSLDDFKKELKIKKEKLYQGKSNEFSSKEVDKFYFCDFSAKKDENIQEDNKAIEKTLKVLREKSQQMRQIQNTNVFKKKKDPEKINKLKTKNSKELNIYKDDFNKKNKFKEALTLKSFLNNKIRGTTLRGELKKQKKYNKTEIRKSSMMTKKNQELLQESLRKYLPKGFKKMKKKKKMGLNTTKNKKSNKNTSSMLSKESKIDNFFKTNNSKKSNKSKKLKLMYPKSQKQMKLDSLIQESRRTGLSGQEDSGIGLNSKKEKSLPKIAMTLNSHKNISQYYSKRYLEKTRTEYDYLGSERATELSKFDISRLSHGSMISNRLKKKVCIKKRPKNVKQSAGKKSKKKSSRLIGTKAITAKKRKFEKKKYFRSENPHLKTAPDIIKKTNPIPKENTVFKNRKDISIPKNLMKNLKSNKYTNKLKKLGIYSKLPKSFKNGKKLHDKTIEGNFGIFDFSIKPQGDVPVIGSEVKSYESLTRLFSQNPKKSHTKSNKRIGYSSSSLKKQRAPSGVIGQKKYNRGSTFTSQKMKINKVKLSSLAKTNPFKGKKKMFKGLMNKYSSHKIKNFKNLTINTFSPKNGFFKHKVLKNLTDKNKSKKGFFNDSMNNYFKIAGALDTFEKPATSLNKMKIIGEKSKRANFSNKLPQQVYNNIRMGDSNVKNKYIINIGNLQRSNTSSRKAEKTNKKYFEGFDNIEKEIKEILKFK